MLASPFRALYEARASRTFWVLFATFFVCGLSTNGLIQTHWISLCGDYGVAPVAAAGRAGGDRRLRLRRHDPVGLALRPLRQPLAAVRLLRAARPVADRPAVTDFTVVGLSAFAMFYGLDWVATVPPTVRLTVERRRGKVE